VKTRAIPDLEPDVDLAQAARRIVGVRAEELFALAPAALDRDNAEALHDLRIAAKRLRYVLELIGFCLPAIAAEAETRARQLQTLIGEIHDHDVLLARIGEPREKGMQRLSERLNSRREALYGEFRALWRAIEASGLRERIVVATGYSPNGAVSRA
jgi:CHAD domain-containing protein